MEIEQECCERSHRAFVQSPIFRNPTDEGLDPHREDLVFRFSMYLKKKKKSFVRHNYTQKATPARTMFSFYTSQGNVIARQCVRVSQRRLNKLYTWQENAVRESVP